MNKSYKRDNVVLTQIRRAIIDIREVMTENKVDFSQSYCGLCNNRHIFDLCAFYMAQIGEKVKLLTDNTRAELSKYANLSMLVYFRNMIDQDYESVNRVYLQAYIQQIVSNEFLSIVDSRIRFCFNNGKCS